MNIPRCRDCLHYEAPGLCFCPCSPAPTPEEIEAAKTLSGTWTKDQLERWGIQCPPRSGWKDRVRGSRFADINDLCACEHFKICEGQQS